MNPFLKRFLNSRKLDAPTGRPLHIYRATESEMVDATRLLNISLANDWRSSSAAAMFCLVTAEWFRARYQGGPWRWREIQKILDISDQNDCRQLAQDGLAWWRRPLAHHGRGVQYLLSLAAEGGLPTVLLGNQAAAVRRFLEQVAHDIADYGLDAPDAVAELAAHHEHLMPQAFRTDAVRRVVADLALWLQCARAAIPEAARATDPLAWVQLNAPELLLDAPLRMVDAAAQALLAEELRATPGRDRQAAASFARRVLNRGAGGWRTGLAVSTNVELDAQGPHAGLFATLGQSTSARLRPSGLLRGVAPQLVVALARAENGVWSAARRSGDEIAAPLALQAPAQAELFTDGQLLGEFELCSAVDVDDLTLWRDTAMAGEDLVHLELIGAQMVQTRRPALYLLSRVGAALEAPETIHLERMAAPPDGFSLWRVEGRGAIRCGQSSVRVRTSAEREEAPIIWLANALASGVTAADGGPVFRGTPRIRIGDVGVHSRPAQSEILRWRPISGGPWREWRNAAPALGDIEIRAISGDEPIATMRAALVPETARVERRTLRDDMVQIALVGFGDDANVALEGGGAKLAGRMIAGEASLRLIGGREDGELTLRIMPEDRSAAALLLRLNRPVRAAGFIAPSGGRAHNDRTVSTIGLPGWRAVAPVERPALLRVRVREQAGAERLFYRSFMEARSLSDMREDIEAAIAASGPDAEANIRVLADGAESPRLIVRRYDGAVRCGAESKIELDEAAMAALSDAGQTDVTLHALNLIAPEASIILGTWRPANESCKDVSSLAAIDAGPWMIVLQAGTGVAIRPCATWFADAAEASVSRFSRAYAEASAARGRTARIAQLTVALAKTMDTALCDDWPIVEAMLDHADALQVTASLDLTQALAATPQTLCVLALRAMTASPVARLDLDRAAPLFWPTVPVSAWARAMRRFRDDLCARLSTALSAQETKKIATSNVMRAAKAVGTARPELSGHLALALLENGIDQVLVAQAFPLVARAAPIPTLRALMAQAIARNGEFAESYDGPPPPPGRAAELVADFDGRWAALLAAPLVAGASAIGADGKQRDFFALRMLQASDPVYFDAAMPFAVMLAQRGL